LLHSISCEAFMKYKFSWLVLFFSGLLLLSGQASSATRSSVAGGGDWSTPAKWVTDGCTTAAVAATVAPTAAEDVTICTATTTAITLSADSAAKSLTVEANGLLTVGAHTLTLSGGLINNAGTAANLSLASSTVVFDTTAAITGSAVTSFNNLTVTGGTLTLAAGTLVGGNVSVSGGSIVLGTSTTIGGNVVVSGGSIAFAATNVVTGTNVTTSSTGTISGTLGLSNANHTITTVANTSLTGVTIATGTNGKTITFTPAGGTTINVATITDTGTQGLTLVCTNGNGSHTAVATGGASITGYSCTGLTNPAPVFSTKEKAKVFVEEVNN
jgi:hypothetical protein